MKNLLYLLLILYITSCSDSDKKQSLMQEAIENFKSEDYEQALSIYNLLLNENHEDTELLLMRAKTKIELDDYKGTIEDCTLGLSQIKSAQFYSLRAASYEKLNMLDRAILDYDSCLIINPKLEKMYNNRGTIFLVQGKYEKAIKDFESAINIKPNIAIFYSNIGLAYENLKKYEKALSYYDKSLNIDSEYFAIYFNRGVCLIYLERYEEAISDLKKVENSYINEAGLVWQNMAFAYYSLKDNNEACLLWKKASDLGDVDAKYYYNKICVN